VPERKDSDREVLTSLPRSRPVRRSAKRGDRPVAEANARASSKPVTPRKPRAAKPAAKTARATPGAGPRATAKRAATKPAVPPRAAAKPTPRAGAKDSPRATAGPTPSAERARPRDTPRRKVPAAGYAAADGRAGEPSTSAGAELVRTTIQAAAELAQIGLTVGRQTLQSMLDRLPRP
jgi:hypothetical protein